MEGLALVSGLASKTLIRITFDGKGGAKPAERWDVGNRMRDVEVAPDGAMWMIEDRHRRLVPPDAEITQPADLTYGPAEGRRSTRC